MTDEKEKMEVYHVLFVDDEIDEIKKYIQKYSGADKNGEFINYADKTYCFHYCESLNGACEILKFSLHPVHTVLLDYFFPEEKHDGFWLLKQIVHMSPDIPVIMLTQKYDPSTAHEAGVLRADRFLDKAIFLNEDDPDDIELLIREIEHVIYKKGQQPELHDRKHLELAEAYADEGYDEDEQKYPATIAYYILENEEIVRLAKRIKRDKGRVDICDIGCGTGRIEQLILRQFNLENDKVSITGIDFSGRMLKRLKDKNLHPENKWFRFERTSAERLELFEDHTFDLVILGFGVPSYTKYHLTLKEAERICCPGGYALFSVYNEDSAIYDAVKNAQWSENERPIAAIANPDTGKLNVGGSRDFDCETFTINQFSRLVQRQGFVVEDVKTFPTLHVSLPMSVVAAMPDAHDEPVVGFPFCRVFSWRLYELDKSFSQANPDRGHYIIVIAQKPQVLCT